MKAKLFIYYEDRIDVQEHTYIDQGQDEEGTTYKYTVIERIFGDVEEIVTQCAEIGTHGMFVPVDNEYIPPHRIEKIKVIGL